MVNFIDFPIFDGVSCDLRQWIAWLEDFFVRERFTADEKLNLAQSLLEGEANAWFYSCRKRFAFQSWEHLVDHLLIWRFGAFGDGGVFSDPELFLLWNKYDRILQKEKRRKRMSRIAITPQESISSPATIPETITVDKFSNQVDEISAEKQESKQEVDLRIENIASQLKLPNTKVHVSDSENLRNIETRIENSVLDNFESVVKEAKLQKNIRMDVINGSNNVSAHQVLDKMCQVHTLLNQEEICKDGDVIMFGTGSADGNGDDVESANGANGVNGGGDIDVLPPPPPILPPNVEPLHVKTEPVEKKKLIPQCQSDIVSNNRVHSQAGVGCVTNKNNAHHVFDELFRMLHDPGGKQVEHSDDIFETEVDIDKVQKTQRDTVVEACDADIDVLDGTATWIVTFPPANNIEEAPDNCLFAIAQTEMKEVLKLKDPIGLENQKKRSCLKASRFNFKRKKKRIKRQHNHLKCNYASVREDWFNTLSLHENLQLVSGLLGFNVVYFRCHKEYGLARMIDWSQVRADYNLMQGKLEPISALEVYLSSVLPTVTSATFSSLLPLYVYQMSVSDIQDNDKAMVADPRLTVLRVLCLLGTLFWRTSFKKQKFGKNWWYKFKHSLWQRVYGRDPQLLKFDPRATANWDLERDLMLSHIQHNFRRAQDILEHNADKKHHAVEFSVGNWVALTLQPYLDLCVAHRINQQLAAQNFDLFQVVGRAGVVSYHLKLPTGSKLHSVFHVSQLKAVIGDNPQVQSSVSPALLAKTLLVPEAVMEVKFADVGRRELLIKWHAHAASETTWMFFTAFVHLFLSLKLEDKLGLQGGSIDTYHQTYFRKKKKELAVEDGDVVETSNSSKDSIGNRGFAVSSC